MSDPKEDVLTPFAPHFPVTQARLDPTELPEGPYFCPALPEPYEVLLGSFRRAVVRGEAMAIVGNIANRVDANHAAAEAEHALRVSLLALLVGREVPAAPGRGQ